MKVYEATVKAASGGFGMYERHCEGPQECEGISSVGEWKAQAAESTGCDVRQAVELEGRIYGQLGGTPYALCDETGEVMSYHLVYTEEVA